MKKILALLLAAIMVLSLAACGGNSDPTDDPNAGGNTPVETDPPAPIDLVLWGAEEDQALLADLVEKFKAAYPEQTFNIQIGVESESTAKDTILTDIEAAADVFAFANDQLGVLVDSGALLQLDGDIAAVLPAYANKTLDEVLAANGAGSVNASKQDGKLYALPFGGGNNYFLYYDSTKITAEQAQSWDGLLAAAEAAGSKVGMTYASGWYNASFFLGAGFTVKKNADKTTTIDWNGTSTQGYTGVQVAQAMGAIAGHNAFLAIPDGSISGEIASGKLAAVVSGTWDASAAQTAFGEGYAATKLPTFTCNGNQVQMACYSGFKLMGVNAFSKNAGWALLLAEFLTNEQSQAARFAARQLPPSNTKAASDPAVLANIAVAASAAQDVFGQVQDTGDKYWTPTATFGEMIAQGTLDLTDTAAVQKALDDLVAGVGAPVE